MMWHDSLVCPGTSCLLRADYRLDVIPQQEAQWAVHIAQEIIAIAEERGIGDETTPEENDSTDPR
jgi:hypothetical protein